ncbi:hypothetical protein JZ751_015217 [Albula glossodonta]|uniref:Fringe-like glycosyltransferase domain-containing protein n=1 Tax=Albula glossodonta TaxID=121402 RepID=A0A8T2NUT7_9TELE|nr:hypothetical protein JZ751_015217 [Albula glossodonta]
MLKSCGKKLAISIVGATVSCLVVLLVAAQHQVIQVAEVPIESEVGMRSLQSLDSMDTNAGAPSDQSSELQSQDSSQAASRKGFSAYFSKLTRDRRDIEKPASQAGSTTEATPAEDINPNDIFIAVKTTKKFHQSRLGLLLDTWISRNLQQVALPTNQHS